VSTFAVERKRISKIYPHSNADKLELAQVEGMTYQFAISKDMYKVGDEVVYFPIDSILQQEFIQQQNIANFLTGSEKNRVKTVKLRGEISQGYVASIESIKTYLKVDELPSDLTIALGVVKYIAPEILTSTCNLVAKPEVVYYYDIEGCDRYPEIVEMLMDIPVVISEKIEGSNHWTLIKSDGEVKVGQHSYAIDNLPDCEEHTFWKVARKNGIIDLAKELQTNWFPNRNITIRSEAIGPKIQDNYYNLKEYAVKIFDIDVDGKALSFKEIDSLMLKYYDKFVPIIAQNITLRQWLNGRTIQQAANGKSILVDRIREGIVIKPMQEQYVIGFGRLFLKQRDPIYLDKTGK